jgi:hypothetical protein
MNWESTFEVIVSQRFAPGVPKHANIRKKVTIQESYFQHLLNNVHLDYEKLNETKSFLNFTLQSAQVKYHRVPNGSL